MRITYLHQYFNTPEMPGGTRSYEMARRLVAQGHDVNMVTAYREPTEQSGWFETEEAGIQVHWLPVRYSNRMGFSARIRAFMKFAVGASRKAVTLPTDVIFATSTPLTIAIPGVYASKQRGVPMVFEVRDLWPELPIAMGALKNPVAIALAKRLEHFAYRNAAHIVALSPGMKEGVVKTGYGYPEENVTVIPNSCDLALFDVPATEGEAFRAKHVWLGDRPLVIYTGTMGHINGVSYLARIAKEALELDPEARFLVVGRGANEKTVRETAKALGVYERNFFMLPPLPKEEMPALLSAATVATSLVIDLPALWVNSANKFFDALAASKPVAINYGGWQAGLLAEHFAGIRLAGNEPHLAAQTLVAFYRDNNLEQARKNARQLAENQFSRDQLALELENVLWEAVKKSVE